MLKDHLRDLDDLDGATYITYMHELKRATQALRAAYEPAKLNHGSYGNVQPHLHWHIFPRFATEAHPTRIPWAFETEFAQYETTPAMAHEVRDRLLPHF